MENFRDINEIFQGSFTCRSGLEGKFIYKMSVENVEEYFKACVVGNGFN